MRLTLSIMVLMLLLLPGCAGNKGKELIIFHAGSLSVPVMKLNAAFEKANPGVRVLSEAAGSLVCARKITELGRPCDIILSADYFVIDNLLIPSYASWNIKFATNEIVIAYRTESEYSSIFREENWADILLRDDVIFGRSDPDSDPCGYRTVFAFQLAEDHYGRPGLSDSLLMKDLQYIRPKEVDLVALTETGVIDYMFQYKSVAIQHGFRYIKLPDEINLSTLELKDYYSRAKYMIPGSAPGERTEIRGDYISYSGTIPVSAPNNELAIKYFSFMLGEEGIKIFRDAGQEPLIPAVTANSDFVPEALKVFIRGEDE
ncbi:MAG: substrate-binding domain-containing protein [Bacteroidales bacterium]|jgi:molybdate/tungstate transport system substrate-binding protein|nr:substrate-binding domain-containing protein [Bacteroidales bacterium]